MSDAIVLTEADHFTKNEAEFILEIAKRYTLDGFHAFMKPSEDAVRVRKDGVEDPEESIFLPLGRGEFLDRADEIEDVIAVCTRSACRGLVEHYLREEKKV